MAFPLLLQLHPDRILSLRRGGSLHPHQFGHLGTMMMLEGAQGAGAGELALPETQLRLKT